MEYTQNTEYYTIVNDEQLNTQLPIEVVEFMGYDKTKTHTLLTACFPYPISLENGDYLINIQLSNKDEYDNKCVSGFISKDGFDLAQQFYSNIFTDISNLEYKKIIE